MHPLRAARERGRARPLNLVENERGASVCLQGTDFYVIHLDVLDVANEEALRGHLAEHFWIGIRVLEIGRLKGCRFRWLCRPDAGCAGH